MLVNFGEGKCPICGDFAKKLEKKTFHCRKCDVAFNEFLIFNVTEPENYMNKYWN